MSYAYESEGYIGIRDALIELLKLRSTYAGNNVRMGRRIPIEDPNAIEKTVADTLPICLVSMERCSFEANGQRGSRSTGTRKASFQIDGYIAHDFSAARAADVTTDEYIDSRLDAFGSQIVSAIEYYATFREDDTVIPEKLRLRGLAEMWVSEVVKSDYVGDRATVIGVVSVTIIAHYEQDRRWEGPLVNLDEINQDIKTGTVAGAADTTTVTLNT